MPFSLVHTSSDNAGFTGEITHVTEATTLTPDQQVVLCDEPSSDSYTITLPPLSECIGRFYLIQMDGVDGGTVAVADSDEGSVAYTSGDLTDTGDFVLLLATPLMWCELDEETT